MIAHVLSNTAEFSSNHPPYVHSAAIGAQAVNKRRRAVEFRAAVEEPINTVERTSRKGDGDDKKISVCKICRPRNYYHFGIHRVRYTSTAGRVIRIPSARKRGCERMPVWQKHVYSGLAMCTGASGILAAACARFWMKWKNAFRGGGSFFPVSFCHLPVVFETHTGSPHLATKRRIWSSILIRLYKKHLYRILYELK